jgi:hypothetical protein
MMPPGLCGTPLFCMAVFLLLVLLVIGLYSALLFKAATCIGKREYRNLVVTVAYMSCLNVPFGLILGVLTLLVMNRSSVKESFLD